MSERERCPEMPPGMHPVMEALIGAQYHRCRREAGHKPPCVNNEGFTWGHTATQPRPNPSAEEASEL